MHRKSAFVRRLPLSEKRAIVQTKSRWLFGKTDVKSRSREEGSDYESKLPREHSQEARAELFITLAEVQRGRKR